MFKIRIFYIIVVLLLIGCNKSYNNLSEEEKAFYLQDMTNKCIEKSFESLSNIKSKAQLIDTLYSLGYSGDEKYLDIFIEYYNKTNMDIGRSIYNNIYLLQTENSSSIFEELFKKETNEILKDNIAFYLILNGKTNYIDFILNSLHSKNESLVIESLKLIYALREKEEKIYNEFNLGQYFLFFQTNLMNLNINITLEALTYLAYNGHPYTKIPIKSILSKFTNDQDLMFQVIDISMIYLQNTNDFEYYRYLRKYFVNNYYNKEGNYEYTELAAVLYEASNIEIDKKYFFDYLERVSYFNDFAGLGGLIDSGNREYIKIGLKDRLFWYDSLSSIIIYNYFEFKDRLKRIIRNGIPKKWYGRYNVMTDEKLYDAEAKVLDAIFFPIESKSSNVFKEIKEMEYILDSGKYSINTQIHTSTHIMRLIWLYEQGEISEERFWGTE